ncbi:phosphotransferase system mannose-type iia component [Lucifera butyrica]|uniref:Phosphotransferase system mannose-type iia component n=1 Tax=Lucifera butyrica TaxID=1351585 RepID=A0A498R993_9FIRM|nr:sigma 54-interacting transcriptional regulator [Lucifera butyrica]VBB07565.1 phosphotransferase system mannose-type iia component [Lucifera butyrica]
MEKLLKLISEENKKDPFTDDELARKIGIARGEIIRLRRDLKIGNSRERMRPGLISRIKEILEDCPNISERSLTQRLIDCGFNISRNLVVAALKEMPELRGKMAKSPAAKPAGTPNGAFDALIGATGSLRTQIELAKAAVLYPLNGLHTLICGPTGAGKSELAECMYKFAVEAGVKDKTSQFVVFNCADYAENPQLLMSQLFGYVKGAFTGADTSKDGLVDKADNGILFLDEIHRLPPEGQEILYYLIDKSRFRRLGESSAMHEAKIMIIAATTADIDSTLLLPFRRRIPMVIELPPIVKRPLAERYEIIINFFRQEATRTSRSIKVSQNAVTALLLYDVSGNVGQLRSDIQVACARAFFSHMVHKQEFLQVDVSDLPNHVVKGILHINQQRNAVEKLIKDDIMIFPAKERRDNSVQTTYNMSKEVYEQIEAKYKKMEQQGIDIAVINKIVGDELEVKIQQLIKQAQHDRNSVARQDLGKIVGDNIVAAVNSMMKIASDKFGNIDETLCYCLATHLAAAYERIKLPFKPIINPQKDKIKAEYPLEYETAAEMVRIASCQLNAAFPEDEIGFVAMYLKSYRDKDDVNEPFVGVAVLSHGHVAEGMVQVANRLLGVEHAKSMEMSLEESTDSALDRAIRIVKNADMGKGVLLLVDMGSLVGFGKLITETTGIMTRTVTRVNTPMVMEAVRKAVLPGADINEIANSIEMAHFSETMDVNTCQPSTDLPKAILCICLTGSGTADVVGRQIRLALAEEDDRIEILTLGALTEANFAKKLSGLTKNKKVITIVGTIDLQVPGVPFIQAQDILQGDGIGKIRKILRLHDSSRNRCDDSRVKSQQSLAKLFRPELVQIHAGYRSKNETVSALIKMLISEGYVQERFMSSVYEREELAPTVFENQVALPHGNPEDVIRPAIAVATLASPVVWTDGQLVDCVFMLALTSYNKTEFTKFYALINNERVLKKIKQASNTDKLLQVIMSDNKIFA